MAIYDLFGSVSDDIETSKNLLEQHLGVRFIFHDSSYHGGYYQYGETSGEHFVLKRNLDPIDGEAAEVEFSDSKILLYVNDTECPDDLLAKIKATEAFVLLRHEDID